MQRKNEGGDGRLAPRILKDQRIGVFVDVQNLFYSARFLHSAKVNFATLLDDITKDRQLVRALAYVIQSPDVDQTGFLTALKGLGYELRAKELRKRADGSAKGDWDMGLAIDAVSMMSRLDVVCIISGDGDFVDLVNMLRAHGVKVEVYSFPGSTSDLIIEAATEYYPLGEKHLIRQ